MRAVRVSQFGSPSVLSIERMALPIPQANQVLIRIGAAGVNPVDTYIRSGNHSIKPVLPYTPGKDGAGKVIEVGESVSRVKPGDRVFIFGSVSGTYAEAAICEEESVYVLPSFLTYEQGACLGIPYGTAYRALFQRACVLPHETGIVWTLNIKEQENIVESIFSGGEFILGCHFPP